MKKDQSVVGAHVNNSVVYLFFLLLEVRTPKTQFVNSVQESLCYVLFFFFPLVCTNY